MQHSNTLAARKPTISMSSLTFMRKIPNSSSHFAAASSQAVVLFGGSKNGDMRNLVLKMGSSNTS